MIPGRRSNKLITFLGNTTKNYSSIKQTLAGKYTALIDYPKLRLHGATAEEILKKQNLSGKACLITGTTSGIGREMARCMSARGCDVIMACRNMYKAKDIVDNVLEKHDGRHRIYEVDLTSLNSVKKCSTVIGSEVKNLDMVILNAGVFGIPWTLTEDGLETIFQVNFLSQFYLLMNIERILAPIARVVFIASESHRRVKLDNMDYQYGPSEETLSIPEHKYTSIKAYNISKLCCLFAMHYLGYRWMNTGKSVFCAHPGTFVKTNLCSHWWVYELLYDLMQPFTKTISQAAATPLYCATSAELRGLSAVYMMNCRRCEESELARDYHTARRVIRTCLDIISSRLQDDCGPLNDAHKAENRERSFAI